MKNKIKLHRNMQELTQEQLAKASGCTRQTINAIEKNKYSPSLELAFTIAKILNVKVDELFILNEN
ncbi:helix-turn-helix transcriptional regulator [Candidatus Izemoplasma sp. B36]|uniref:helix-turn-helix transcriptional regulator n=1 Tax=Candidatus Izemoplasma sp. B36 TaxID=3242468 RepID=UPI003558D948